MKKFTLLCAAAAFAMPVAGYAQQITTQIEGQVTDAAGAPIPNAAVTITDTRTGATREITASEEGLFSARNLASGGPYTVTATAPGFQGQSVEQIFTTLQGATQLTFSLTAVSAEATEETIVVTGTRARVTQLATGPGTSFSADVLEVAPTFNRDIRDVIRLDPRVSLERDEGDTDRISCLGGNDRGNAFTVDGITQSDVYGLNDTGFSARSSTPLPYDAIRETQVQFAPFDVEYGQFTGCAINVVTRSGTNEFHGSAFFEYTADELQGDRLDGEQLEIASFKDQRWGATLGGPVIRDRLFLFGAYEKQKSSDPLDEGPLGGGFSTELTAITQDTFNRVSEIIRTTYGIDTGAIPKTQPFSNERWFARADLRITDDHRLEATYQRLEEAEVRTDDYFTNQNSPQVAGINTFLTQGSVSNYYSGRLYSNWSDRVSTELRYSRSEITDRQDPIGGGEAQSDNPIPRIIVGVSNAGRLGTILAGPGISRTANDLRSTIEQYKASMNVDFGNHQLKFGAELNRASIFNLFVANATGTLIFRNIADLQAGLLSPGTGNNSTGTFPDQVANGVTEGAFGNFTPSGDVTDAAAEFQRLIYTVYAQDDWRVSDNLQIVMGIRTDWYDGGHPDLNPNFVRRYGIGNNTGFSNIDPVILPRLAATYDVADFGVFSRTQLRAGLGIFSGGDPLVWFGNAFQNDGSTFAQGTTQATECNIRPPAQFDVVVNGQFTGVPQCIRSAAATTAARSEGFTQSIDPDIKMTTVLRANLGLETRLNFGDGFLGGWRVNLDYIWSRYRNPFTIVDLAQAVDTRVGLNGFTVDGRPIYRSTDLLAAGCTGRLVEPGSPPVFQNINAACFPASGARVDELMLTNAKGYTSQIASFLLSKDFGRGVFTEGGNVYFTLGYAYTDARDRRNFFNSTAGSNYDNVAAFDRQNPAASTGFYSTRHNFTLSTTLRERFFGDNDTTFGFSFVARSGRPYSLTFTGGSVFNPAASGSDNALLYIPTGVNDPNVVFQNTVVGGVVTKTAAQNAADLIAFLDSINCDDGYAGRTIRRNTCSNDWFYDLDLRFSQELPGPGRFFGVDDKIELYGMVDNFLNLLDSSWNIFRRRSSQGLQDVARLSGVDAQGRYLIGEFTGNTFAEDNVIRTSASLWRLKVGVSYKF